MSWKERTAVSLFIPAPWGQATRRGGLPDGEDTVQDQVQIDEPRGTSPAGAQGMVLDDLVLVLVEDGADHRLFGGRQTRVHQPVQTLRVDARAPPDDVRGNRGSHRRGA